MKKANKIFFFLIVLFAIIFKTNCSFALFTDQELDEIQSHIHYTFRDSSHLKNALTHPSTNQPNSEFRRLALVGDGVIKQVARTLLYSQEPALNPEQMTNRAIYYESTETLASKMKDLMGGYLKKGKDDGNRIYSESFEALVGAIHIDQGEVFSTSFLQKYLLSDLQIPSLSHLSSSLTTTLTSTILPVIVEKKSGNKKAKKLTVRQDLAQKFSELKLNITYKKINLPEGPEGIQVLLNQRSNPQPISERHPNKKSAAAEIMHKISQPHISAQWSNLQQLNRSERLRKIVELFSINKGLKNLSVPQVLSLNNQEVDSKMALAPSNQRILVAEKTEKEKELKLATLLSEKMQNYKLPFNFQYLNGKHAQACIYGIPISQIYHGNKKTARKGAAQEVLEKLENPEIAQQLDFFKNASKKQRKKGAIKILGIR